MPEPTNVRFFRTPAELRRWFRGHHASATELWVGYYRKGSGRPSITWQESVDEALCVGWIDGVRKKLDADSYTNRFTPRRKGSIWSAVNIARVAALTAGKRMRPAGLKAFAARLDRKSGVYTYEVRRERLDPAHARLLAANAAAAAFFRAQPPYYRRLMIGWVAGAKKEETRMTRLRKLIDASARGKRLL